MADSTGKIPNHPADYVAPEIPGMRHIGWHHSTSGFLTKYFPEGLLTQPEYMSEPIKPVYVLERFDGRADG
jgi:hypothetical protein